MEVASLNHEIEVMHQTEADKAFSGRLSGAIYSRERKFTKLA